jgi:hypothetical protein
VALGIATSFISGMKLWARARNTDLVQYYNLLSLEKVARELRQGIKYPSIGFEVEVNELSFPCLINDSIVKVTYRFDSMGKMLLRKQISLTDILEDNEPDIEEKAVLSSLDDLSFSYFVKQYSDEQKKDIYTWKEVETKGDEWLKEEGIFPALKVKVKIKDGEFQKTIFIPIS